MDSKKPIVSGEPLFSSKAKFDSGIGWPSFVQPLEPENTVEKEDRRHGKVRVEVRSKHARSHLGHVFPDGPAPAEYSDAFRRRMNWEIRRKENVFPADINSQA